MPFTVTGKVDDKGERYWVLRKEDGKFIKTRYKTREAAVRAAYNFIRYRGGDPYLDKSTIRSRTKESGRRK